LVPATSLEIKDCVFPRPTGSEDDFFHETIGYVWAKS
jgi:hypothetical protein